MVDNPMQYLDVSWRSTLLLCLICPIVITATTLCFRQVETNASRYLAAFLVLFSLNLVPQVIGFAGFYQAFPWLTFAPFNNELWLGPLLLLHALALTKHRPPTYMRWLLFPAVMQTLYYTTVFLSIPDYKEKWAFNDAVHTMYILPIESLLTISLSFFCGWQAYLHAKQYQHELLDVESDQETFDISWLRWLIGLTGMLIMIWSGYEIFYLLVPDFSYPSQYPFHVTFSIIVLVLSQRALSSIRLPFPRPLYHKGDETELYESQNDRTDMLIEKIRQGLTQSQWYLNQQFSLSDLARALNSNETYVSKAINTGFQKNFNTLINESRVEHAKQLLAKDPKGRLSHIMFDSGFSSKASFNRCFKATTGITPSQYQRQSTKVLD